jgi:hypothetical protein
MEKILIRDGKIRILDPRFEMEKNAGGGGVGGGVVPSKSSSWLSYHLG